MAHIETTSIEAHFKELTFFINIFLKKYFVFQNLDCQLKIKKDT